MVVRTKTKKIGQTKKAHNKLMQACLPSEAALLRLQGEIGPDSRGRNEW